MINKNVSDTQYRSFQEAYIALLKNSEDWIIDQVINYSKSFGFAKYTSTLREAWKTSIRGLTDSLINLIESNIVKLEIYADSDYSRDSITEFGRKEAQAHRSRGIPFDLFFRLMKYYRQAYHDLVENVQLNESFAHPLKNQINIFFDKLEVGFTSEWMNTSVDTQLKILQEKNRILSIEKNKYLTIFESTSSPIIILNEEGQIVNLNHSAAKIFYGVNDSGTKYYNFEKYLYSVLPELKKKMKELSIKRKNDITFEKEIQTFQGKKTYEINAKSMLDVSSKFSGTVLLFQDITFHLQIEKMKTHQLHDLQIINRNLEDFAHVVSHDLKNPLSNIALSAQLLEELHPELSNEGKNLIAKISKQVFKSSELIEAILNYSKLSISQNQKIPLDLNDVVKDVIDTLSPPETIRIIINDLPVVRSQQTKMFQIFLNLISNSIKFVDVNTGIITIKANVDESYWKISVEDNGCGIKPGERKFIFKPFHKGKNSTKMSTGIGLAIVKRIVISIGGKITFTSQPSKGTTFTFTIPKDK